MAVYAEDQLKFWSQCLCLSEGMQNFDVVHSVTQDIDFSKSFFTFRMSCGFYGTLVNFSFTYGTVVNCNAIYDTVVNCSGIYGTVVNSSAIYSRVVNCNAI